MKKTIIIAEIGVNHNGDFGLAEEMIIEAKKCGADYVKFQTAKPELVISKFAEKAEYQKLTTKSEESQLEMCKKIHLPFSAYPKLMKICHDNDIKFLSTPFDLESIDFLDNMGVELWKIPSGEITNLPYLIKIGKTHKPVIMSTGMSFLHEVKEAIHILRENGCDKISLLHCNTEYPTPYEDVNLYAMNTLKNEFDLEVGYSDHTAGIEVPIAAVTLGAAIIEKHFTLSKKMEGPDHKASLEPYEFSAMVNAIRNIEEALGSGQKKPSNSELKNINIARKSIVAKIFIKKGEKFSEENITTKRPGNGISPMQWYDLLGKEANRDFVEDELIEL